MVPNDLVSIEKEREEISQSEDDEEKDTIRLMAIDCGHLFDSSLARTTDSGQELPLIAMRFLTDYRRRFEGWCSYMCVKTEHDNMSLDYRLQNHLSLQDMVIRLLGILRDNLFLVSGYQPLDNIDKSCNSETELPAGLQVGFAGIRESIHRLSKLGITIRTSSRSTFVARARRFATQYPKDVRLSDFEDRAHIALQYLYPSAPEGLRQQLVDSMTDRYAKICYEAYRTGRVVSSHSSKLESQQRHNDKNNAQSSERSIEQATEQSQSTQGRSKIQEIPIISASSAQTAAVQENIGKEESAGITPSKASKTLVGQNGKLREPQLPEYAGGKHQSRCEWCPQFNEQSWVRMSLTRECPIQWTAEGQRHYRQDLEPYVCLAEACCEARPSFAFSNNWLNHMKSHHSEAWSSKIHSQPLWTCNAMTKAGKLVHENDTLYAFSSKEKLMVHFKLHHPGLIPDTEQSNDGSIETGTSQTEMEPQWSQSRRSVTSCPLCLFCVELENETDEKTTIMPNMMELHIADHLHHLMIVTLQIMKAMEPVSENAPHIVSEPSTGFSGLCSELCDDATQERRDERLEELLLELRETYQEQLAVLKSLCSQWTDNDLLWVIDDAKGDLEASKKRISKAELDRNEAEKVDLSRGQALSAHNLSIHEQNAGNDSSQPQKSSDFSASEDDKGLEGDGNVLRDLIQEYKVESKFVETESRRFIPQGALDRVITEGFVAKALKLGNNANTAHLIEFVCSHAKRCFAITAYGMDEPNPKWLRSAMRLFSKHGFTDTCLPVEHDESEKTDANILLRVSKSETSKPQVLSAQTIRQFCSNQWVFLAPVFSPSVPTLDLSIEEILPFIRRNDKFYQFSFGYVDRYEIHADHIVGFPENFARAVAVKTVVPTDTESRKLMSKYWAEEGKALAKMNNLNQKHIVRFINSFRHRNEYNERYYLVSEWADGGNLQDLWEEIHSPKLTASLVKASLWQLYGLAAALSAAHYTENGTSYLHGDLKPANILWFYKGGEIGTLKIGNWGDHRIFAELGHNEIVRHQSMLRYEAPEVRIGDQRKRLDHETRPRSRLVDLWSMGCITLEFLIWLLYGTDALYAFEEQLDGSPLYQVKEEDTGNIACVHEVAVEWMVRMAQAPACQAGTTALGDLLEIVQHCLLVVKISQKTDEDTNFERTPREPTREDANMASSRIDLLPNVPTIDVSLAGDPVQSMKCQDMPSRISALQLKRRLEHIVNVVDEDEEYWCVNEALHATSTQQLSLATDSGHSTQTQPNSPISAQEVDSTLAEAAIADESASRKEISKTTYERMKGESSNNAVATSEYNPMMGHTERMRGQANTAQARHITENDVSLGVLRDAPVGAPAAILHGSSSPRYYFQINEIRESIYAPGSGPHGRPPWGKGAHVVVNQGASNMWWFCDGKQIYQSGYPTGSFVYSTYSVFYSEGFGFWILRGDAGNPDSDETWQPLYFDQDQNDPGSSYLCNVARRRTVAYRRDTPWLPMLLPDIYYARAQITNHEAYGGLKGELAIFLALIAFSIRPELLPTLLPHMLQNGAWATHTNPHGRQEKRGVTVTICIPQDQKAEDLRNYEKKTKYFN